MLKITQNLISFCFEQFFCFSDVKIFLNLSIFDELSVTIYIIETFFSLLLSDREERRIGEKIFIAATKPINYFCPTLMSVPVETVGRAMIANLWNKPEKPIEALDNAAIHKIGGEEFKKLFD